MPNAALRPSQLRVTERLGNPHIVTEEQARAASHEGDGFISACPGSGKTRTVGLRLAYHAAFDPDMSLAALSHTNTAVNEIREAARELFFLPDHYFVGTLHSFLLRYVVYPFGHLRMASSVIPRVVGDEADWHREELPDIGMPKATNLRVVPWRFHLKLLDDAHGKLAYDVPLSWPLTSDEVIAARGDWGAEHKEAYWKQGLLSYSDVPWIAYDVLVDHPEVAAGIAARFDELVVDEIQDTSPLQVACLKTLRRQDIPPNLVLVGDLCQAVYEWSGATPESIREFAEQENLPELPLTANFRSSQPICNITHHFSTRPEPDRAAGPNAGVPWVPELWTYGRNDELELVSRFRARLKTSAIPEERAAVLAWANSTVDRLNGRSATEGPRLHWLLRELGRAAVERDDQTGPTRDTFRRLDRVLAYIAFGSTQPTGLTQQQREELRIASSTMLAELPKVVGYLAAWNLQAREKLADVAAHLPGATPRNVNNLMTNASALKGMDSRAALAPPAAVLARTIHDAKGESIDAVMVVARARDAEAWADGAWLDKPPGRMDEVVRVAYVAFTRAARLLILALPEAIAMESRTKFLNVGFVDAEVVE